MTSQEDRTMQPGLNLEFARSEHLNLEQALRAAAEAGYRFVEPDVYSGLSMDSRRDGEVFHSVPDLIAGRNGRDGRPLHQILTG